MTHQTAKPAQCPNGKKRFSSKHRAEQMLHQIWARPRPGRQLETRTYQCPFCGYWHLTSRPDLYGGNA